MCSIAEKPKPNAYEFGCQWTAEKLAPLCTIDDKHFGEPSMEKTIVSHIVAELRASGIPEPRIAWFEKDSVPSLRKALRTFCMDVGDMVVAANAEDPEIRVHLEKQQRLEQFRRPSSSSNLPAR